MDFGVQMIFQSYAYGSDVTDAQVYEEEIALGLLAEELGFDKLWPVEHHFEDYAFCPDNTQFLSYMAARTSRIALATGAVILPWNDPLRVAEKVLLLDHLSKGRAVFGMGRGLARREYGPFRIDMDSSRDRFDEAAPMILDALETGVIEGRGPYYSQPRTVIRPRPLGSFKGRTYCVAMSPDSVLAAARLGARPVMFSQRPWEAAKESSEAYRSEYSRHHREVPPPPVTCDFVYCDDDAQRAEEKAREHLTGYLTSVLGHYELAGEHFKSTRGYESYGAAVDLLRELGLDAMRDAYLAVQIWGTPTMCIEKIEHRQRLLGDFDLTCCFRFAGLAHSDAERSMRTFATKVMAPLRERARSRDAHAR